MGREIKGIIRGQSGNGTTHSHIFLHQEVECIYKPFADSYYEYACTLFNGSQMCMCVCVCARAHVCVCVCVCIYET